MKISQIALRCRESAIRSAAALLLLCLASTCLSVAAAAGVRDVKPEQIDALFANWNRSDSPGCALAVVHDGRIVYERGYGMADLEHSLAITPATVFYVGSDSKQFAAFAIALLVDRKVIALDDDVRKFVPELPDYGHRITVQHLVHHTSGLRDYLALRGIAGQPSDAVFGDDEALRLIARQKALNFNPGEQHLYSNSGYFLLSVIVKRATGKTLREFAAENIFQPLGMKSAEFRDDHTLLIANRADAYEPKGPRYARDVPNFDVVGAGGLYMSVRDFLPWDQNFYDARVGGPAVIALMTSTQALNGGKANDYAFGLTVGKYRGLDIVEHGGAYGGYRAHLLRLPGQKFSVAVFANVASVEPGARAREVADLYLADLVTEAAPKAEARRPRETPASLSALAPEKLAQYTGEYFSDEVQAVYLVTASDAKLMVQRGGSDQEALTATGKDVFSLGYGSLKFIRRGAAVRGFSLDAGRVTNLEFVKRK